MEKTTIIGHIGKDASVNEVNGRKAINFNVAVNRSYKKQDGTKQTVTNWYSCTRWINATESTEVVRYLTKGTQVFVEGSLQPQMYKTKDNQTAIDMRLNVKSIQLLGSKQDNANKTETSETTAAMPEFTGMPMGPDNDDLPF